MDRFHVVGDALEVEGNAHAIGGRRAKIGVELHVSSCAQMDRPALALARTSPARALASVYSSSLPRATSAASLAERSVRRSMARSKAAQSAGSTTSESLRAKSSAIGARSS